MVLDAPPLRIKPVESQKEWEEARSIRHEVFIVEQECAPEEEWDQYEDTSRHVVGYAGDEPVAVARWRSTAHDGAIVAKLERFAVRAGHRGRGYGRAMVRFLIEDASRAGFSVYYLHAQEHLAPFYASFGFRLAGERFMEANIPHVPMIMTRSATNMVSE
ncbi:MAG: GNAT family N-acetyltransferase [Rhodothermales bacterium]